MRKRYMLFFIFIFVLLIPIVMGQGAPPVASWWGTVEIDGNTSNNAVVEALVNSVVVANTTVGSYASGYYLLDTPCTNGTNVAIKVYGVEASQSGQICSQGTSTELNLTMNKTANSVACTYGEGCTSGYCVDGYCCNSACSGACNFCNVSGSEGTCTNVNTACAGTTSSCYCSNGQCSACSSGYTCSSYSCVASGGTSGGGGGGGGLSTSVNSYINLEKGKANITISSITTEEKFVETIAKYEDMAIRGINITVKNNVADVKIIVSKISSLPSTIPYDITGKVYHYINIEKINITDADIVSVSIKFAVNKTWLTNNNVDVSNITFYRWANNKWNDLNAVKTSENSEEVFYDVDSPGLSIFIIGTKEGVTKAPTGAAIICKESWSCTDWSECIDGKQTRTCKDLNKCGIVLSKPTESKTCEISVPKSTIPLSLGIGLVIIIVSVILIVTILKKKKNRKIDLRAIL